MDMDMDMEFDTCTYPILHLSRSVLGGQLRTLPVSETHVGSSEGLGSIAGLVRSSDSDVAGCRCPAARDGRRGENDVFRPLRGIASGFVRARLISCGECELAGLPYVPGSCERPLARCEGRDEVRGTCQPGPADSMATPAEGLSRRSAGRGSIASVRRTRVYRDGPSAEVLRPPSEGGGARIELTRFGYACDLR